MSQRAKHQEDLSYANSAKAAVLYQSPRGGQLILWTIALFLVAMVIWAYFAEIDEFTRGEGQVIPSSSVQIVQNLEGGIVAEVMVAEGQVIDQGQTIARLEAIRFEASLRESEVSQQQLMVKAARLQAEAQGQRFDGKNLDASIPQAMIDSEQALFLARSAELTASKQVIAQQQKQKTQELSELTSKSQQLERSAALLEQELSLTEPLVKQGAVSQVELLRLQREVNDIRGLLESNQLAIPRVQAAIDELKDKELAEQSVFRSKAQADLLDVQSELSRLLESSQALVDQVDRTLVVSPVKGTIKQLFIKTIGGVVQPGAEIAAIVPSEDRLLVEAKIRPADIAFLHPNQEAIVKFTAYDFSIHGGLKGKVVSISPDTISDEEGNSFYLVQIETDQSFLGTEETPLPIIPGMIVSTDILTGKKTILDYLLKPILKTKSLALRER